MENQQPENEKPVIIIDEASHTGQVSDPDGTQAVAQQVAADHKKVSHTPSVTGIVLAAISLMLSSIGNALVHAHAPSRNTPTLDEKIGQAVDNGTTHVLGALFGVPFLVGGITLAIISGIFLALRMRKIRATGMIFTLIAVLVIVWSFSIAVGGFDYIRAKPAN